MMHMWNNTGAVGIGSSFFWLHLHWYFVAFSVVGFVLLTVWALKNLSGSKLKVVAMWILIVGIIGTLVTAPLAATGFQWMMGSWNGGYGHKTNSLMMNGSMMMDRMMNHDEGAEGEEHDEHEEMEEMMR